MSEETKPTPEDPEVNKEEKKDDVEESIFFAQPLHPPKTRNLVDICIEYAKRMNGYPYISCSLIKSYDDTNEDPSVTSNLVKRVRMGFIMTGHGDKDEFVKRFVNQPIVYIQAHAEMPTLAADGCYNNINIHGKPFKSFNMSEHVILKPEEFVPFIIVYKDGKFGKIEGNPYRTISKDEALALAAMSQSDDQSSDGPIKPFDKRLVLH